MVLAGIEGHKRAGLALHGYLGALDRDPAGDYLHNGPLANLVIAKFLSTLKVDRPAIGSTSSGLRPACAGLMQAGEPA